MKIKVSDFITNITEEKYEQATVLATKEQVEDLGVADSLSSIIEKMQKAIKEERLAQTGLLIEGHADPIAIKLETGIINLPFENIKRVENFFDDPAKEVPVNVYLVVVSPDLNVSGLHIMQICPASDFVKGQGNDAVTIAVAESLRTINENILSKQTVTE